MLWLPMLLWGDNMCFFENLLIKKDLEKKHNLRNVISEENIRCMDLKDKTKSLILKTTEKKLR